MKDIKPVKLFKQNKLRLILLTRYQPFLLPLFFENINSSNYEKGAHFSGQPMCGQLINLLSKEEFLKFSREHNGERYVKLFDAYQHLVIMLYAVIKRFNSLRKITDFMFPEARKLAHLGIKTMPRSCTLSDANARRPAAMYEDTYRSLYVRYNDELSSDSRNRQVSSWLTRLQIIDSTIITLLLLSAKTPKSINFLPKSSFNGLISVMSEFITTIRTFQYRMVND